MDNSVLASLNVVPFVGLMNLLEVKYMHMPEVYRTVLAILCDYNPITQSNIVRTRHYLRILLSREPDLAQCLLNFIDEPKDKNNKSLKSSRNEGDAAGTPESPDQTEQAHPHSEPPAVCRTQLNTVHISTDPNQCCSSRNLSPASGSNADASGSKMLTSVNDQASGNLNWKHDTKSVTSGNSSVSRLQHLGEQISHFVPVINIQHRNMVSSVTPDPLNVCSATCSQSQVTSQKSQLAKILTSGGRSQVDLTVILDAEQTTGTQDVSNSPTHQRSLAVGSTTSQSVCLSKLLGQPSVACLPPGHYLENRNSIVGGSLKCIEPIYSSTLLDAKVSSAAAKLRMLSTQAGSDKVAGSMASSGAGIASTTVTATLGCLNVQTQAVKKQESEANTFEVNGSATGESINPASKMLPVASVMVGHEARTDRASSDKQVQAGERQVGRPTKIIINRKEPGSRDQGQAFCSSSSQLGIKQNSAGQLQTPGNIDDHDTTAKSAAENIQQAESETSRSTAKSTLGEQNKQTIWKADSRKWTVDATGRRVQVVEVSVGTTTNSLSAFPYIQQMLLPDSSQASATSHSSLNTPTSSTTSWISTAGPSGKPPTRITCKPLVSSYQSASLGNSKPTTQIILPRNQVKLSVSIQTSSSNHSSLFNKGSPSPSLTSTLVKTNFPHSSHTPLQARVKVSDGTLQNTHKQSDVSTRETTSLAVESTTKEFVAVQFRGKRKRSCSVTSRSSVKRCNKNTDTCTS